MRGLADRRPKGWGAWAIIVSAGGLVGGLVVGGCGGGDENVRDLPRGSRGETAVREQCGEGGGRVARAVDVNNDGTPDIRHVYQGDVERCAQYDMNFDGIIDVTRFFDTDGTTIVREEHDFDFDGRLDQISYFEGGRMVRAELDTDFDNEIDTWRWCDDGRLMSRAERDRRHRGRPDTWETFEQGLLTEAQYDDNNDGQPDRWEYFNYGRLARIARDIDLDGEPDQQEDIPTDSAGQPEDVQTCDGSEPPPRPEPPPTRPAAPPAADPGTTPPGETGVVPAPGEPDPFGMRDRPDGGAAPATTTSGADAGAADAGVAR